MCFWAMLQNALPSMVGVPQTQTGTLTESNSTTHTLQPIEEFFLFLNYLALGSMQRDLADRYGIHQSTVNRIIKSWSNFLFTVLGSVCSWIPEEEIRRNLPADFKDHPDTAVILHCVELRCRCPASLLQSEAFSSHKSHSTLKGLVGIAPHGPVTFVSALYAGSINDKRITSESGVLNLLKPEMAIMVDKNFLVDKVPCKVYKPALLSGRPQICASKVRQSQAIARLRVHVESSIRWIKEHKVFDSVIPLWAFGSINQLYTVACLLTNDENGPLGKT